MVICSLDALKKSKSLQRRKKREQKRKQSRCYNKLVTIERGQEIKRSE